VGLLPTLRPRARAATAGLASTILVASLLLNGAAGVAASGGSAKPAAKNIIVMISDGLGYNHLKAASYYEYGKDARQIYNRFPVQRAMSTYSSSCSYDPAQAWGSFEYVKSCYTDSAAAATAMATGVKTYDAGIGVDASWNTVANGL